MHNTKEAKYNSYYMEVKAGYSHRQKEKRVVFSANGYLKILQNLP